MVTAPDLRRILWSSIIGTAVEWYDFLIYATATALVFNRLFFPTTDASLSTIIAFGTYGVGFLARPIGAALFGHFGDRVGRKAMLATTIAIMGLGTFAIGVLPTYSQIGVAAPALLVALRFLQGIGLGGEWGGAVLMVVENAPAHRRGLFGSMVQIGNPVGNLAALGMFNLVSAMPDATFLDWGWRIPFLVSIALVGVGLWIRMSLQETPVFQALQAEHAIAPMPVIEVLTRHRRSFFIAIGLKISEIAWASVVGVFAISYTTATLGLPRAAILQALLVANVVALGAIPLFGHLSDRFGRKTLCYLACAFGILFAFPLFWCLDTRDATVITLAVVAGISFGQMIMFGIGAPWYSELFPARLRYSGASLGFQIGAALSGGLTPLIAATLVKWSGGPTWPISLYLAGCALVILVAALAAPETARVPLMPGDVTDNAGARIETFS